MNIQLDTTVNTTVSMLSKLQTDLIDVVKANSNQEGEFQSGLNRNVVQRKLTEAIPLLGFTYYYYYYYYYYIIIFVIYLFVF